MVGSRFKTRSFKDIDVEEVKWLWKPYLPLGKISFIAGDPGVGKSFLTIVFASIVSMGEKFPFADKKAPSGNIIIQNGEDGAGDTIKKRLIVSKANDEKVHIIELKKEHEDEVELLLTDVKDLDILFEELKPKLVIFDPITAFLGDINMNSASEVRQTLKPIGRLAEKYNCSILFVIHRNKGTQGGNQLHKLLGSVDFGGIARSVISVGHNPDNKSEKLLMHTKSNLSELGVSIGFTITENGVFWLGTRGYMQDDSLLNKEVEEKIMPRNTAKEFIIEYLKENGNSRYDDISKEAEELSISSKTLERARDDLRDARIIDKEYINGKCFWYLIEISPNHQGRECGEMGKSDEL